MLFRDRADAGHRLAACLEAYRGQANLLVLALPRGGVPVAAQVARALDAPLDVFTVRKLGVPGHEELAMGAITTGGWRVLNEEVVGALDIPDSVIEAVTAREALELERREQLYRADQPAPAVTGRSVLLVDDGLATGTTMRAAVQAVRQGQPERIVVAVPVGSPDICAALRREADAVVCAMMPEPFHAVGLWYQEFSQTTDEEVRALLASANEPSDEAPPEKEQPL